MDGRICSFCLTEVSSNHAVAIFSQKCLREGNISLLESVFAVEIKADDGMPGYACRSYFSAAKSLHTKISKLQTTARKSYDRFKACKGILLR